MTASGSPFSQELYAGYMYLTELEDDENDFGDAAFFLDKASRAAGGEEVPPQSMDERELPPDVQAVAAVMHGQLMEKLDLADEHPALVAKLQVAFDCYLQEKEENNQPRDIRWCEKQFAKALAAFPEPVVLVVPPPEPQSFIVYFALDSADLSADARQTIDDAAAAAEEGEAEVLVSGHADRSGSESYNLALSKRRAQAVADALIAEGVPSSAIDVDYYGESSPARPTADGVVEQENRRVTIYVE
jgi:outer membrane protein OmpA-like peptidoglycan-associated protein